MGLPEINRARIEKLQKEIQTLYTEVDAIDPVVTDDSFPNITPPTPVVTASALFRNIQVMWDFNTASYIAGYELYASKNAGFTPMPVDLMWKGSDSVYNFPASTGETWYFKVRSFNTHGTFSEFSNEATATTVQIDGTDIDALFQEQTVEYSNQYTDERETAIMGEVANKLDAQVYHDNIILKADKVTVQEEFDAINTEMADKANTVDVNTELALRELNIHKGTVAPTNLEQMWLDTSVTPNILKHHNGTVWVNASPTDAGEVGAYTKTEVDTALDAKASQTEFNTLTGRMTTAETSITQNTSDIALRATKTELDTLTGRVGTAETNITQNSTDIALKASQTDVDNLTGRVSSAETSITQNASDIALKANATTVNALSDRVTSAESNITLNANNIALKVSQSTYDLDINDATNGLIARMNNAEADISVNAGQIALKASQTELDTRIGDVVDRLDTAEASITVNANNIALKVDTTTYNALEGRVTTAESDISLLEGEIILKASQIDLNAIDGRLDTAEASITTNANAIALRVEKNGVISSINQSAEDIKIDVAKMTINGDLEVLNGVTRLKALTVGTAHIQDDAIVERMIANNVIANKINAGTALIDFAKIGNVEITSAMIQSVSADKLDAGTITGVNIESSTFRSEYPVEEPYYGYMRLDGNDLYFSEGFSNGSTETYDNFQRTMSYDSFGLHYRYDKYGIGSRTYSLTPYQLTWQGTGNGLRGDFSLIPDDGTTFFTTTYGVQDFTADGFFFKKSGVTMEGGGQTLELKAGPTSDHTYMAFYPDSQNQSKRFGYIGYSAVGSADLAIVNDEGNITLTPKGNLYLGGTVEIRGFDLLLGTGDQSSRGNSGSSRALVKDSGNILAINYGGDFTGGVSIGGPITNVLNFKAIGAITLQNNWKAYPSVYGGPYEYPEWVKYANGQVQLKGMITDGLVGYLVSVLPAGARPYNRRTFICLSSAGHARVDVESNGNLSIQSINGGSNTGWVDLSNVSYMAQR